MLAALRSDTYDCILWPRATNGAGYAKASNHLTDDRQVTVSRWICEKVSGPPPSEEHHAAHECRNRNCINPKHLSWKTPKENNADKLRDGTEQSGENHPRALLQDLDVRIIKKHLSVGLHYTEIAEMYGVGPHVIYQIKTGRNWSHVPSPY